ncbi:hypothetical protein K1719_039162 [Acacia pycnantha]|nr:hypothetical protein K1719_039162 [Acacia pycnantha]
MQHFVQHPRKIPSMQFGQNKQGRRKGTIRNQGKVERLGRKEERAKVFKCKIPASVATCELYNILDVTPKTRRWMLAQ